MSIGVAVLEADEQAAAETLIQRADAALYRAKRAGRDRIAS
ncbi:MAG: diguanylate cyclase domain-containing protein [Inhella sp.]